MREQWEALMVGINYYPFMDNGNLEAAEKDAKDMAEHFQDYGYYKGNNFHIQCLPQDIKKLTQGYNQEKTVAPLIKQITSDVKEEDLKRKIERILNPDITRDIPEGFLFFFSGHGYLEWSNENQGIIKDLILLTSDSQNEKMRGISALWLAEQIKKSEVKKVIILLDCCHSGALFKFIDSRQLSDKVCCFMTATRYHEQAIEEGYKQGQFTKLLLEGLQSSSYKKDPQGIVTSKKLEQFIENNKDIFSNICRPQVDNSQDKAPLELTTPYKDRSDQCPYVALESFKVEDASYFYGRSKLIKILVKRIKKDRFLAVLGESGSGKSSLLQAGLLYHLKWERLIQGSYLWTYIEPFTPTENPLQQLSKKIDTLHQKREEKIQKPIIMIIDQFEECFLPTIKKEDRKAFFKKLNDLLEQYPNLHLIIGMRSEFRSRLREYPSLFDKLNKPYIYVEHLNREEIEEAIIKPAEKVGLVIDNNLKEQLINDVEDYPGSLPLLQYTLTQLWQETKKEGRPNLTLKTYNQLEGIEGTLEKQANKVFNSWDEQKEEERKEKAIAKRIFLELTQLGDAFDLRRRVCLNDLANDHHSLEELKAATDKLEDKNNRLILKKTIQKNKSYNEENEDEARISIEVVHEALIRHWRQLQDWRNQYKDQMYIARKIEIRAQEWQEWLNKKNDNSAIQNQTNYPLSLVANPCQKLKKCWIDYKKRWSEGDYLFKGGRLQIAEDYLHSETFKELAMLTHLGEKFIKKSRDRHRTTSALSLLTTLGMIAFIVLFAINESQQKTIAQFKEEAAILQSEVSLDYTIEPLIKAFNLFGESKAFNNYSFPWNKIDLNEVQGGLIDGLYTLRERNILRGHQDSVHAVAFSSDSQYIVTGGNDKKVILWNISGEKIKELLGHDKTVRSLAFSSDNQYIVSGGSDNKVILWEISSQKYKELPGHEEPVYSVAFSPNSKYIVTGGDDQKVILWDVESGEKEREFSEHESSVYSVAFSPDSQSIVSSYHDGRIIVWDISGKPPITFQGHQQPVNEVAFSPDGRYIVSGSDDGTVRLWTSSGNPIGYPLKVHGSWVNFLAWSKNGQFIVTAGHDGTVGFWKLNQQLNKAKQNQLDDRTISPFHPANFEHIFQGHDGPVLYGNFSPDGKYIASASSDGTVRLWDTVNDVMGQPLTEHKGRVMSATFSPDGESIVSASQDNTVRLWDRFGNLLDTFKGHEDYVYSVAFNPTNPNIIVSGSKDQTLKLWDICGKVLKTFPGHDETVHSVAFSPNGQYIISGSWDDILKLWDISGKLLDTFAGHSGSIYSVAFSPTNPNLVVSGSQDKTVKLWDISRKQEPVTLTGHEGPINSVAFSPDGQFIISGSEDATVRMWDTEGNPIGKPFKGHTAPVNEVIFSHDGQFIVSGGDDLTIRRWDIEGNPIGRPFRGHRGNIYHVAVSPDNQSILSSSADATMRLWKIRDWRDWIIVGCDKVRLHNDFVSPELNDNTKEAKILRGGIKTCLDYGNWTEEEKIAFLQKQNQQ